MKHRIDVDRWPLAIALLVVAVSSLLLQGCERLAVPEDEALAQRTAAPPSDARRFGQAEDRTLAQWGRDLHQEKVCVACHPTEPGLRGIAPSHADTWGTTRTFRDGSTIEVTGDEGVAYIRESIVSPSARIVEGYQNVMPSFATNLSDDEIDALVRFIQCLSPDHAPEEQCAELDD